MLRLVVLLLAVIGGAYAVRRLVMSVRRRCFRWIWRSR